MRRPISRATSLWVILRSVWRLCRGQEAADDPPGVTVPQVVDETQRLSGRDLAYTTVATQLKMLEGKGLLSSKKRGRNLHYRPTVDEPTAVAEEIEAFLANVIHDDLELLRLLAERVAARCRELGDQDPGR